MAKKSGLARKKRKTGRAAKRARKSSTAGSSKAKSPSRHRGTDTAALKADLKQARATIARLRAASETDFLLGIFNRRGVEREMTRAIAFIKRYGGSAALVALDVDRLKPVNDKFGHAAGDSVLKAITALLTANVRASDSVARLGGDEFVLLLWNLDPGNAQAKAQSLERAVDALSFSFGGKVTTVGASAGVTMLASTDDPATALARADEAMYARKTVRKAERRVVSER